jgi:thiol:disulfide interchange protein DsbD
MVIQHLSCQPSLASKQHLSCQRRLASNVLSRFIYYFFVFLFTMAPTLTKAELPLPADQAFVLSASVPKANEIELIWRIAANYYLYVKQIQISFDSQVKSVINLPQGELRYDTIRGRFEAYAGDVRVPIQLQVLQEKKSPSIKSINMQVNYQGCSAEGFCYPPIQRNMIINLNNLTIAEAVSKPIHLSGLLTDQNMVKQALSTGHLGFLLLIFTTLGLFLAFTPCVLPMIPILVTLIVGQKKSINSFNSLRNFLLSLTYVLGTAVTYAFAGLLAASLGATLQLWLQQPWIIAFVSGLFVVLALSLFGLFELRLPAFFQQQIIKWTNQQTAGSYLGVFCMGILSTLIVSPCVTAPLVGVLMYIAQTGDKWLGSLALFTMGLGMGMPLLLVGMSAGRFLPKSGSWMILIKKLFGLLMIAMAIWLMGRVVDLSAISPFKWRVANQTKPTFTLVRDIDDFNHQLLLAKSQHQRVLLDFYADWCDACVIMDSEVFAKTVVKQALSNYKLLRIDLTANTKRDELLLKYFNVIAPPTVIFFDTTGIEFSAKRVVGELGTQEFLSRLQSIKN